MKKRKNKTTYAKKIYILLALYGLASVACFVPLLIAIPFIPRESATLAAGIGFGLVFVAFLTVSALTLFYFIPKLKKAQAREDFAKADFSPYQSRGDEIFECDYQISRYTFAAAPFDGDEIATLHGESAILEYLSQYSPDRIISEEQAEDDALAQKFYAHYFSGDGLNVRAEKKLNGDVIDVRFTATHRAEFTEEGLKVDGTLYPYEQTEAYVKAEFGKDTNYAVRLKILLLFSDEGALVFDVSSRIAAVLERFGITVNDREKLDYILADPLRAYEQTALQLVLKKLK